MQVAATKDSNGHSVAVVSVLPVEGFAETVVIQTITSVQAIAGLLGVVVPTFQNRNTRK